MTEDEAYRASTQYRLWSFTPEALEELRVSTNSLASEHVRAAIKRARDGQVREATSDADEREIECLTVAEELKLVGYYCRKAMDLSDFCSFPTNVKVVLQSPRS